MRVKSIGSNMTEVSFTSGINSWLVLVSYETPVAAHLSGAGFFRTSEKFSTTTTKHINKWLDGVNAKVEDQAFFDNLLTTR